jgi:asparaginyl-tRNA synthetase
MKFNPPCSYIKDIYESADSVIGTNITLWGHVRSIRTQSGLTFITIYDGSHIKPFQAIVDSSKFETEKSKEIGDICGNIHSGSFIKIKGIIVKSPAKGQSIEMLINDLELSGKVIDTNTYLPLVKNVQLDLLRGKNAYIRPKFQTYMSVYSIRDNVDKFINEFMRFHSFKKLDPNILSSNDCEGAGEMFNIITNKSEDEFFGKKVGLTVSSQLQLEALIPCAVGVYTMNKSFRAEKSKTTRHLAEFTHLEWESKFIPDIKSLMDFNEDMIRTIIDRTLKECNEELQNLNQFISKGIIKRLEHFIKEDFGRISYTEAIEIIDRDKDIIKKLYTDIESIPIWGDDLGSRCERYLAEHIYKKPLFVFNYPRELKSFYMKINPIDENGRYTVQGCDLLIPFMGELIGSSVREENYDTLLDEIKRRDMDTNKLDWYLDLRKNGGCITSGAGMGFDRLIQIICYMDSNIRDVVPFPISYKECEF